jgi:hypothetical protein
VYHIPVVAALRESLGGTTLASAKLVYIYDACPSTEANATPATATTAESTAAACMCQQTAPAHNFVKLTNMKSSMTAYDTGCSTYAEQVHCCRPLHASEDKRVIRHGGSNTCPLHLLKWNLADGSDNVA